MKNIHRPLILALLLLLGLSLTSFTAPVSAAPESCSNLYNVSPMSSDKDKAQAVDLKNACNQGWETDNCDGLKNTKHTTKAEKEAACKAGQEYRAVNPPDDGSAASGCDDIKTDIVKCTGTSGTNPLIDMILQVINFLAVGVGIAVVGGIIWGGMLYASSNGDSAKAKQGIVVIVNAVLGLLLFIFMYALINYLVPGGLFA